MGGSGSGGKRSILGRSTAWIRRTWAVLRRPLPRPVRALLLWLTPVLLLLAGLGALFSLSNGIELRTLEQHQYDADTTTSTTTLVAQSFLVARNNLDRIDMQLATRPNLSAPGEVRLLEGDGVSGRVLYSAPFRSTSFARDPFLTVAFPPISNSEGMAYTLVFQAPDRPLTQAFAVRYNSFDMLSSGSMYTDDGPQDGDLVISAYYRYEATDLLGDILATLSGALFPLLAWIALLFLPGLALLSWIPSGFNRGQSVLAAPALTALVLPVFLLVMKASGLPIGALGLWLIVLISAIACAWAVYKSVRSSSAGSQQTGPSSSGRGLRALRDRLRLLPIDLLFWGLLALLFVLTLAVRFVSLRDAPAGMGLDAYHHTLIARMIIDNGGIPGDYQPYAPLASFTYHYGFHTLIASVAWLTSQTRPEDLLSLMPQVGQFATALPVLTLPLFAWRAFGNRWAGLIAGALAGLVCIFPAYYVNWSRYTQGLGLAVLPVAWLLALNVLGRSPASGDQSLVVADQGNSNSSSALRTTYLALQRSGPYILGVIGVAGLFLTHYRIAMIFAVMFALYVVGRLLASTVRRPARPGNPSTRPEITPLLLIRRAGLLALLTLAALSPWLLNLAQNFHSHLVGRDNPETRQYYDLGNISSLVTHPTMWALYITGLLGLLLAIRQRVWPLLLVAGAWALLGLWSDPYLFDFIAPGLRLPYSGYLDITTWAQSLWLPLGLLSGYALELLSRQILMAGNSFSGLRARLWRTGVRAVSAVALLLIALAIALPIASDLDSKPYFAPADREALLWMRDNLPRNATVLANPFAFEWAPTNVYGSDAGMWIPLMSGVQTTVPPLPAYNERLADPNYLDGVLSIIQYEPFSKDMTPQNWQSLKDVGITHIYVGSRGGALNVPLMLSSDYTQLIFHKDGVYVFALR